MAPSEHSKRGMSRRESLRLFGAGAKLLVDGVRYKQARNDASNPTTVIVAPKLATRLTAGQTVALQVRNPDGQLSNELPFTA